MSELEDLFIPWHNHKQRLTQLSSGVWYLGHFVGFGEVWAKRTIWQWDKSGVAVSDRGHGLIRSQSFQEKALDAALADLKDCVILSTTPTCYSQFQNACLLKSRGFRLLLDRCYRHPGDPSPSRFAMEHPGIPDRHLHWEHIWWKVVGQPKNIGLPADRPSLNNCGVDGLVGLQQIVAHDNGQVETANTISPADRKRYLAVAWLPRGTVFPQGWKRFYSAEDYKLGVNFDGPGLANVQKCPHNFDLKIFEGWEPDFEKWVPS